jgi:hypothetical protein
MNWSTLEKEIPRRKHFDTIHQIDVMINNLKKVIRTSKSSMYIILIYYLFKFKKNEFFRSKPRLSVHERRKQRLASGITTTPVISIDSNVLQSNEIKPTISS